MGRNLHIKPHLGGWAVQGEGKEKPMHVTGTRKKAVETAGKIAKNQQSKLIIHEQDGKIKANATTAGKPHKPNP